MQEEDLESFLKEHGIDAEIVKLESKVRTVKQAAKALGIGPEFIIKTIMFVDAEGEPLLAIVPGNRRVDLNKLSKLAGSEVRLAKPAEVESHSGYPAGGLPPIGHKKPIKTYIDPEVLEKREVYGGGGSDQSLLRINPEDIKRVQNAEVAPITMSE